MRCWRACGRSLHAAVRAGAGPGAAPRTRPSPTTRGSWLAAHVDALTGALLDAGPVAARAHAAGALFVLDAGWSVGAVPVDAPGTRRGHRAGRRPPLVAGSGGCHCGLGQRPDRRRAGDGIARPAPSGIPAGPRTERRLAADVRRPAMGLRACRAADRSPGRRAGRHRRRGAAGTRAQARHDRSAADRRLARGRGGRRARTALLRGPGRRRASGAAARRRGRLVARGGPRPVRGRRWRPRPPLPRDAATPPDADAPGR